MRLLGLKRDMISISLEYKVWNYKKQIMCAIVIQIRNFGFQNMFGSIAAGHVTTMFVCACTNLLAISTILRSNLKKHERRQFEVIHVKF